MFTIFGIIRLSLLVAVVAAALESGSEAKVDGEFEKFKIKKNVPNYQKYIKKQDGALRLVGGNYVSEGDF